VDSKSKRWALFVLAVVMVILGESALWFLLPTLFDRFGVNVLGLSVGTFFMSVFFLVAAYLIRHAQGKTPQRWRAELAQAYVGLAVVVALGIFYETLLPEGVLLIWPYGILPIATMLVAYYVGRRIPRIKERLDRLSYN
jgi:amino acid transporter